MTRLVLVARRAGAGERDVAVEPGHPPQPPARQPRRPRPIQHDRAQGPLNAGPALLCLNVPCAEGCFEMQTEGYGAD